MFGLSIAAALDDRARCKAWQVVQKDAHVAGELRGFSAAVERRFGNDTVRAMLLAVDGWVRSRHRWHRPNSPRWTKLSG